MTRDQTTQSFFVRRRFHAGYSVLGRQIRRRVNDDHYAEGIYILALSMIGAGLALVCFFGWVAVQNLVQAQPERAADFILAYAVGQAAAAVLFFFTCIFGFKPALEVALVSGRLFIQQGDIECIVPLDRIRGSSSISALQFHRHYRKYKNTRGFFVRLPATLLLLTTDAGPIALGLSREDQNILLGHLNSTSVPAGDRSAVSVV